MLLVGRLNFYQYHYIKKIFSVFLREYQLPLHVGFWPFRADKSVLGEICAISTYISPSDYYGTLHAVHIRDNMYSSHHFLFAFWPHENINPTNKLM